MRVTPFVLDRTINVPFLLTVVSAVLAGAIWTSTVSNRLDRLEERTTDLPEMQVRLARMDERGEADKLALQRIERRLELIDAARR